MCRKICQKLCLKRLRSSTKKHREQVVVTVGLALKETPLVAFSSTKTPILYTFVRSAGRRLYCPLFLFESLNEFPHIPMTFRRATNNVRHNLFELTRRKVNQMIVDVW